MRFEIDDATLPWTWDENRFDFVHIRYLVGAIRDYNHLFREAFTHTKPGGWIQSVETDSDFLSDDGTTENVPAIQKWNELFREAGKVTGAVFSVIAEDLQRKAAAAVGYADIQSKTFKVNSPGRNRVSFAEDVVANHISPSQVPMGGWARDPNLAEIGRIMGAALDNDIEG